MTEEIKVEILKIAAQLATVETKSTPTELIESRVARIYSALSLLLTES